MANADRIIELLHEAKARPAGAERKRFLDEACRGDAEFREQIDSLLEADANDSGTFLTGTLLIPTAPVTEKPGDRIGRYKLLEQIGEGGCGVVYMAEQEEPVRRRVALKVIKLGMDTQQVIARFEAERQALALMDHPNIAKVFDGGATQTGRPYFVMELVRGVRITEFCDEARLSTEARLRLFVQVCQAVQHAHQKGIIHRDLKPSNILVTVNDGAPVPKVIDFGIAKATGQRLTDKTVFTQFHSFIGTPAYTSPEQAEMSSVDIDTRSDIYSLGVLLYELLIGRTPFDGEELLRSGLDEMRRILRETEPMRPSTRLSTLPADELTTSARRRHTESPKLIHLVRGDLDWIVMKALEKDRTRRYETASGLAGDVQRHLDNEPVVARPPSLGYVLLKFVERHRTGVSVGIALALTVLLGAGVSVWQAVRAGRHADLAETRRREAESSRQEAAQARERAERSVMEVSHQLARHYVDNGVQRLDAGDYAGSWVWFAEALRVDQANPAFESIHRLRLGALSRACPTLLQFFAHADFVVTAEFSPDGRRLVTASMDKTARVWDVNTGAAITAYLDHTGGIVGASFSPDGQRVVTRGFDKTARIWSAETGAPLTPPMPHGETVGNAAFSPDGRRLVTVSADQTGRVYTQVWDPTTGQPLTTPVPRKDGMWPAVFSPDTRFIVTGLDNTARVWNVDTGQPETPVLPHTGKVEWAAFTTDGKLVATASADRTARIWDARTGAPVTPPLPHSQGLTYVAFSPDGHRLVTASGESVLKVFPEFPDQKGEARVWDVTSGQPLTPPMSHQQGQFCAAFSPDGRRIVTTSWDKTARIWDAQTGVPLTPPLLHRERVWRASFSPDGRRLATACLDHTARIWDVTDRRIIPTELKESRREGDYSGDYPVSLSPDGQRVVGTDIQGSARVWNTLSGTFLTPSLHEKVTQVIFSPEGRLVATVGHDRSARIWDAQTGAPVGSPMRHDHRIHHLAFSPDGQRLATASRDQTARLWSVETGTLLTPVLQHSSNVLWVAFSPDGRRVVTASEDKTARVWNATNGAAITPPLPHKDGVLIAAFSPDSQRVVTACGDGNAQMWDADTGVPLAPPMKQGGRFINLNGIESLSFSPDGHRIVIADSTDKSARVWDADTGTPVTPPLRHADRVPYAAFSHHGRYVVTVSADKTARVWDAATGQPITPPFQHDGRVDYAMFTADDRAVRTISHNRETRLRQVWTWDLSPDGRSTKDLLLWAELFSGQRFDASGALTPLNAEALAETWRTLRTEGSQSGSHGRIEGITNRGDLLKLLRTLNDSSQ